MVINTFTGRKRKRATYSTSRNNRSQALYAIDRLEMRNVHEQLSRAFQITTGTLYLFILTIVCSILDVFDHETFQIIIQICLGIAEISRLHINLLRRCDSRIGDIFVELRRGHSCRPRHHVIVGDYTPDQIRGFTTFFPWEIEVITDFLGLYDLEDEDGFIRIESGVGTNKFDKFKAEEIMIFVLKKMKLGASNTDLVDGDFGGDARKWSILLSWFFERADPIIQNKVGFAVLERFQDQFHLFASKISSRIRKGFWIQNAPGEERIFVPGSLYLRVISILS